MRSYFTIRQVVPQLLNNFSYEKHGPTNYTSQLEQACSIFGYHYSENIDCITSVCEILKSGGFHQCLGKPAISNFVPIVKVADSTETLENTTRLHGVISKKAINVKVETQFYKTSPLTDQLKKLSIQNNTYFSVITCPNAYYQFMRRVFLKCTAHITSTSHIL